MAGIQNSSRGGGESETHDRVCLVQQRLVTWLVIQALPCPATRIRVHKHASERRPRLKSTFISSEPLRALPRTGVPKDWRSSFRVSREACTRAGERRTRGRVRGRRGRKGMGEHSRAHQHAHVEVTPFCRRGGYCDFSVCVIMEISDMESLG